MQDTSSREAISALATIGAVRLSGPFAGLQQAWSEACAVVDPAAGPQRGGTAASLVPPERFRSSG